MTAPQRTEGRLQFDLYALRVPLRQVPPLASEAERLGFSGLWFTESAHNPFLPVGAAALVSERLVLGTDVAVAFPRSPMVTAQAAWDLADASGGRFVLGLGTQVKAHVERRFSTSFSHPGPRLREYVLALRAIWRAFQGEAPLKFSGDYYSFSLLTEFFSPGPIKTPDVPVYIAGVNAGMARVAGEVSDGFHVHPLHSLRYLREVIGPAVADGAARANRPATDVALAVPVFMAVGDDDGAIEHRREALRRQIAFYGSTPSYRAVFDLHGWGDTAAKLTTLQRQGDYESMADAVRDDMLDTFAVTSTWDQLAGKLLDRYAGTATRVFPYGLVGWDDPASRERWAAVATAVQAG
ncbi:MAG TPA: TIGR03617 family F420-dependent LLM class oxidoreductase [Acidimicrobiales bacterium]|nr:TIGR03617 family F420-dependent LLM class oxidoreductase [Acidimicrobiales bacterium]